MENVTKLTIKQLHEGFKAKQFTSVEVTKAYLAEIAKKDKEIGAYLSVNEDFALEQAQAADKKIATGDFGMLTGIPFAVKDNILVRGQKATAASKILENYVAPYNAAIIEKLQQENAVVLGKTNLDEFAMGSSTENSAFGTTKNPHDTTRVAGGSSGGSAAAVAAEEAVFGLGTDTGGSVRQPASLCGVVGFKPTYGAVSRYGLIAFASSLDQAGPLTKNVEDAKIVFKAISGRDAMDATSQDYMPEDKPMSLKGLRIGIPKEYFGEGLDKEVEKVVRNAIAKAEAQGATIVEVSLPSTEHALACYYIIAPSEASANLARFDGIKYGLSVPGKDLLETYVKSKGQGFGAEVKRRIMIGTYTLSSGYYDAYYKKAQEVRDLIRQDFREAFEKADVIMGPTSPTVAFKIGEKTSDPLSMYLADIYTVSINLAGVPAISIPAGKAEGLPVGLQIIGNYFEDSTVLSVAAEMEKMLS